MLSVIDHVVSSAKNACVHSYMLGNSYARRPMQGMPALTGTQQSNLSVFTELQAAFKIKLSLLQGRQTEQDELKWQQVQTTIAKLLARLDRLSFSVTHTEKLKQLDRALCLENMKEILVSQGDGSRQSYLGQYITGKFGLGSMTKQYFSVFHNKEGSIAQLVNEFGAICERLPVSEEARQAAQSIGEMVNSKFGCETSYDFCVRLVAYASFGSAYANTNAINVRNVVNQLGLYKPIKTILKYYKGVFIPPSGMGHLPPFLIDKQTWMPVESERGRDLVASKTRLDPVQVGESDSNFCSMPIVDISAVIESIVDMAYLTVATDMNLPVYGSCQGAHIAWLAKGEELVKWDKYGFCDVNADELEKLDDINLLPKTSPVGKPGRLTPRGYGTEDDETTCLFDKLVSTDFDHATVMITQADKSYDDCQLILHPMANLAQQKLEELTLLKGDRSSRANSALTINTSFDSAWPGLGSADSRQRANSSFSSYGSFDLSDFVVVMPELSMLTSPSSQRPVSVSTSIAIDAVFDAASRAVEYFKYGKRGHFTQSHPFKHLHQDKNGELLQVLHQLFDGVLGSTLNDLQPENRSHFLAARTNKAQAENRYRFMPLQGFSAPRADSRNSQANERPNITFSPG